jgi:competence protein ComEC
LILFFIIGYNLSSFHHQKNYINHYHHFIEENKKINFQIKLLKLPIEKEKSYKIIASIIQVSNTTKNKLTSGKILIYLEKTAIIKELKIGDRLNLFSKINKISSARNPNEFNYRNYLLFQNINYQTYVKTTHWDKVKEKRELSLINHINRVKNKLQETINTYIYGENERAIASALLLGNRSLLNEDILNAFSSSGATHILAVSGLHVGIFYTLISVSLSWMLGYKKLRRLHPIITILAIWFYVLLTGASPSVMRAATIFTFFAIAKSFQRNFSVYNIIAFSAFILITIDPFLITEVGFQLSYIAVIGIIYLQPKIYKFFIIKNYLLDKIWSITAVSVAAQISTVPLIVLYFHQFPNLFWLSNLIVIPAAAIILYSGIILFIFSWSVTISNIIGHILSFIILYLNKSLQIIESIPYALSKGLYISPIQTLFIYLFIIWFSVSLAKRSKVLFHYSLIILLIISFSFSLKYIETKNQKYFTVYHTPKHTAIELIIGNTSHALIDPKLRADNNQMLFRIKHNWWEKRIVNHKKINTVEFNGNQLTNFENHKIMLIDSICIYNQSPIIVDYVVFSNTKKLELKKLTKNLKAKTYIFDCSNKNWQNKYKKAECLSLGLNCYFVSDTNAFVAKL